MNQIEGKLFGEKIIEKASGGWQDRRCHICGQYFKIGERISIILPHLSYKKLYKKLSGNVVAHEAEISELKKRSLNDNMFLITLGNHHTPRADGFDAKLLKLLECFEQACREYGYYKSRDTDNGMVCKKRGFSDTVEYNVRTDRITYRNRRKKGLLDGLLMRQIEANIYNKLHEKYGDNKIDNYNVDKIVNTAIKRVDDMFN